MIIQSAVFDGFEYGFRFKWLDGSQNLIPVLRSKEYGGFYIGGKQHPFHGYWRFPKQQLDVPEKFQPLLNALSTTSGFSSEQISKEFDDFLSGLNISPGAFSFGITQTIYPVVDGFVVIGNQFHAAANYLFRNMGGTFLKQARGWMIRGSSILMITNNLVTNAGYREEQILFRSGSFEVIEGSLGGGVDQHINLPAILAIEACTGAESDPNGQIQARVTGITPTGISAKQIKALIPSTANALPHQITGAVFAATKTGCLIADEMGTGKTRTAIIASKIALGSTKKSVVIVVAPKSVLYKWKSEILSVYPDDSVQVIEGKVTPSGDWIITNYETVDRLIETAAHAGVLLIDEAHKLKESKTIRTRLAFDIASVIPIRYLISATPILNRESEMHSLLRLSGHPLGDMDLAEFTKQFAGSKEFRNALNRQISKDWMIRRLQSQVLRGRLPGKSHYYPVVPLPGPLQEEYREILARQDYAFAKIHKIRRLLEIARVPIAVEYFSSIPHDEKMIVFVEYVESCKLYADALSACGRLCLIVTGANSSGENRHKAITALQQDEAVGALAGTFGTCSEGVDMWRANHVFLGSQPWVPAIQSQAEDRANRLGQTRKVNVIAPLFEGTIDLEIRSLLDGKAALAQEILDIDQCEHAMLQAISKELNPP